MKSWISKKFASKIGPQTGTLDINVSPEQVTDLPTQISRIEYEFKRVVPTKFIMPFSPTLCEITPRYLVLSDSNSILFFDYVSSAVIQKDYASQINFISYSSIDDFLYISGANILKISLETLDIVSELPYTLAFFRVFKNMTLGISDNKIQSISIDGQIKSLYEHPDAFILDFNNTYIFSLSNYLLTVFSDTIIFKHDAFDYEATHLSSSNNFLAVCGKFACILIINLTTWEKFTIFPSYSDFFYWVHFKPDSDLLIAAGLNNVVVQDLGTAQSGGYLVNNKKHNKICGFLQNGKVFSCFDYKLNIFNEYDAAEMNDKVEIKIVSEIKGLTLFNGLVVVYSDKSLFTVDLEYFNVTCPIHCDDSEIFVVVGGNRLLVSQTGLVLVFNSEFVLEKKLVVSDKVYGLIEYNDSIITISSSSVKLINASDIPTIDLSYTKKFPTSWTQHKSLLMIGDSEGIIKILDLSSGLSSNPLSINNGKIKSLTTSQSSDYLLSISDKNDIGIWNLNTFECFYKLSSSRCSALLTGFEHYCFCLSEKKNIEIWDLNDFNLFTVVKSPYKLLSFSVLNDKIIGITQNTVILFNNPLVTTKIQVFGIENDKVQMYKKKVLQIISNKTTKIDESLRHCVISPYKINLLFLAACFNNKDELEKGLNDNSLHPATCGETSVSICMKKNFTDLTKILFKYFKGKISENPFCLYYLENSFLDLNTKNVPGLFKLYNLAMGISVTKNLPKFCINPQSLPISLESSSIFTVPSQFMPMTNYSNLGKAITFTQTFIKLNTTLGSQESINFLKSLIQCSSPEIFKTQLIKTIISQKWEKVRILMLFQGLIYTFYLISLSVFVSKYQKSSLLIFSFTLSNTLLAYELFQMFSGFYSYLSDLWNIADLIRACLFFVYCMLFWTSSNTYNELLAIIVFLTWSRGITYFRLFSGTRYYINLLFEVMRDMSSFFIIFFYSVVGFGLVFFTLSSSSEYFDFLTSTYILNFGNFDTENYNKLEWLFFLLVTVFNPIIMLNLLISIMSDTYSRVKQDFETADLLGLCYLVLEIELLMFWRRDRKERNYLHVCQIEKTEEDLNGELKYIKDLLKTVKRLGSQVKREHEYIIRGMNAVQTSFMNFNVNMDEIKRKLGMR